jgi:hypothetical protein
MLFVGLLRSERLRDREFWAVLWQGEGPPPDFELIAAYNLLTDLRVLVFTAESIGSIRWLDRLNMVGSFECHPALDQTDGYQSVMARDLEHFERFFRGRGAGDRAVEREVRFRRESMETPTLWHALQLGKRWQEQPEG